MAVCHSCQHRTRSPSSSFVFIHLTDQPPGHMNQPLTIMKCCSWMTRAHSNNCTSSLFGLASFNPLHLPNDTHDVWNNGSVLHRELRHFALMSLKMCQRDQRCYNKRRHKVKSLKGVVCRSLCSLRRLFAWRGTVVCHSSITWRCRGKFSLI